MNAMLAGRRTYVLALVVFALLAVLAIRQGPNWGDVVQLIAHSKVQWVVLATAIPISFGAVFSSARLQTLLLAIEPQTRVPFSQLVRLAFITTAVNNLAAAPAGEAFRCVPLGKRGIPLASCLSAQMFEKVIEIAGLGCLAAAMCLLWPTPSSIQFPIYALIGCAIALAFVTRVLQSGISFGCHRSSWPPIRILSPIWLFGRGILERLRILKGRRTWLIALMWSMAADISNALSVAAVLESLDIEVSPALSFSAVLGVRAAALAPAIPGRIGVQEAGMVLALSAYGISSERALASALLHHACNLLPVLMIAAALSSRSFFVGIRRIFAAE